MDNEWILVADSAQARLFSRRAPRAELVELQDWAHPESRLHGRDLESDRPGRVFASHGHGQSDMQETDAPHRKEAERFAGELADVLERARTQNRFERLTLVAEPRFLGLLRNRLSPETAGAVTRSLDLALTREPVERIRAALDRD
ncbi:host attachment protein [Wenzhouxiangella sp. XN79A]|uniref:host attachment protein n=1 Tax=Wenzhouxiangella sp. XN79A TaxID=2724193 RepID=UPI00144AB3D4|nr:host attachment protein [Wenzhouxiangella sp. XN79A]NKI36529.1 host attachment protein [Wenzhouxiangella sp. XN79A]